MVKNVRPELGKEQEVIILAAKSPLVLTSK